jgi:hypothetical protein
MFGHRLRSPLVDEVAVLPVLPWTGAALLVVLLVALNVPAPATRSAHLRTGGSWFAGRRSGPVALLVVVGLVVLSRTAGPDELTNPVPALVVGLLWPTLLVLPALASPLLRRRAVVPRERGRTDVRPAVAAAAAVVGYLCLAPRPADPAALGTALASYAVVAVAVAVAAGGRGVGRTEVLGLLVRWAALGPWLVRWHPPRGAAAVLAVVLGGAWAERAQRTSAWTDAAPGRPWSLLLLAAGVAVAGLAAVALTSWADGRAAPVLLPLAAAAVLAGVLRRAVISAQLLWDSVGPGAPGVSADPLGIAGGQAAALAVATLGGALAVAVLARRVGPGAVRLPGTGVVLVLTAVTGWVVLAP